MKKERIDEITKTLTANEAELAELFKMEPDAAAKKLGEKGFVCTAEELFEYGELLNKAKKQSENAGSELDENALESVAGGGLITTALVGVAVGYWVYGQKW